MPAVQRPIRKASSMIYFLALIPATALTLAGYCVLYISHRSEGGFRAFGKYLGFWAFSLAALVILGAIFAAAHGCRYGGMMRERSEHGMMHRPWGGDGRNFGPGFDQAPEAAAPGDAAGGHGAAPPQNPAPPPPR
jgi:hypothetical protein